MTTDDRTPADMNPTDPSTGAVAAPDATEEIRATAPTAELAAADVRDLADVHDAADVRDAADGTDGPRGPAPFAVLLGVACLVVAGVGLAVQVSDLTIDWAVAGPVTIVVGGLLLVVVGWLGLRRR